MSWLPMDCIQDVEDWLYTVDAYDEIEIVLEEKGLSIDEVKLEWSSPDAGKGPVSLQAWRDGEIVAEVETFWLQEGSVFNDAGEWYVWVDEDAYEEEELDNTSDMEYECEKRYVITKGRIQEVVE